MFSSGRSIVAFLAIGASAQIAVAAAAFAQDVSLKDAAAAGDRLEWSAYVQGTSDYVLRGISQTRREPTVQGGVDATYGMFYVGTFISGVNFKDSYALPINNVDSHVEIDLYGGIKPKWHDVIFDFGLIGYIYPKSDVTHPYTFEQTYMEFKAGASTTILRDVALSGTVFYSPNYTGETGQEVTLEGTISKPIYKYADFDFAASGTLGRTFFEKSAGPAVLVPGSGFITTPQDSYTYWNIGLTTTFKSKYSLDLRYWDTDLDTGRLPCGADTSVFQCGPSFVATAKVAF
jgi:uncharacterized protein (TIGR02001 family)